MLIDGNSEKSERQVYCEEYVEHILKRPHYTQDWGVVDVLLQTCPRHYLTDVALLFLGHFQAVPHTSKEELY